ncbi:hypothetical protein DMW99_06730 [Pseudomonas chlororaphis]|nr:hypothetical protein C1Y36_03055 [Pseudomonas sp. FW306-2-2C-D06C]PYC40865.1 hypothetical protein DMW99_06730 [Pseudomonas chlororaphis]
MERCFAAIASKLRCYRRASVGGFCVSAFRVGKRGFERLELELNQIELRACLAVLYGEGPAPRTIGWLFSMDCCNAGTDEFQLSDR